MESFIEFFTFQYANIKYVVFGAILLSISSSVVGCFTFVKKKSLVGDVISHSVLPGICLAFILSGSKNLLLLVVGAFVTGWLSVLVMDRVTMKTKIKEDTATGLSLSVFFGIGMLLLTYIQQNGNAAQSGLDTFLFGKAAALVGNDLIIFSSIALLVLIFVSLFYKEFKLISFDKEFALVNGYPIKRLEVLLTSLTVLAVVTGIQAVGVVLMAAMLITPAAAARFWSNRLSHMIFIAMFLSAVSGVGGAYVSYILPAMPTGPWMVMILSVIAIVSFFVAPERGILIKQFKRIKVRRTLLEENVLKALYHEEEERRAQDLALKFQPGAFKRALKRLTAQGYIQRANKGWTLTTEGKEKGKAITRRHRLWELYLTKYLNIASDHVHEDADTMEHILTPEMEQKLIKLFGNPTMDPHQSTIPY